MEASKAGFLPLTVPYQRNELWMMHNVINDLTTHGTNYMIVQEDEGLSIWRTAQGLK